eukprot:GHVU01178787.1.p1 GENE.GHVU01178787.1~~GHVU01178787.1.p1  ORF type:complete len:654 (+),score=132.77 GHVU01178787.1:268-1962(+)
MAVDSGCAMEPSEALGGAGGLYGGPHLGGDVSTGTSIMCPQASQGGIVQQQMYASQGGNHGFMNNQLHLQGMYDNESYYLHHHHLHQQQQQQQQQVQQVQTAGLNGAASYMYGMMPPQHQMQVPVAGPTGNPLTMYDSRQVYVQPEQPSDSSSFMYYACHVAPHGHDSHEHQQQQQQQQHAGASFQHITLPSAQGHHEPVAIPTAAGKENWNFLTTAPTEGCTVAPPAAAEAAVAVASEGDDGEEQFFECVEVSGVASQESTIRMDAVSTAPDSASSGGAFPLVTAEAGTSGGGKATDNNGAVCTAASTPKPDEQQSNENEPKEAKKGEESNDGGCHPRDDDNDVAMQCEPDDEASGLPGGSSGGTGKDATTPLTKMGFEMSLSDIQGAPPPLLLLTESTTGADATSRLTTNDCETLGGVDEDESRKNSKVSSPTKGNRPPSPSQGGGNMSRSSECSSGRMPGKYGTSLASSSSVDRRLSQQQDGSRKPLMTQRARSKANVGDVGPSESQARPGSKFTAVVPIVSWSPAPSEVIPGRKRRREATYVTATSDSFWKCFPEYARRV